MCTSVEMAATSNNFATMWRIYCFILLVVSSGATKLNVPKVLLPYFTSVATNFSLEVSDGCFKWRSSRPEVVSVNPVGVRDPSACSAQAVVSAVSKTPTRMTSIVIAEDPVSGQQLRCDVIVDVIHSIDMETTTRELYLEDSPEQFTLRALDDEGNVFSSLEGITFEWSLISDTDVDQESIVDAHNVLRILQYEESSYETPPYIERLERQGKQGNSILVEGIRTGSAKVSAKLADAAYKKVSESIVRLIVIANIMLNPPLVYLMRQSQVHYRVELLKQGKVHEIPMPSAQYFLELKDNALCSLDRSTSIVTATTMGFTEIVLKDKNIKVKEAFRQPSGGIYVVSPGYLGFVVLPGRKWVLEAGRNYEILIEIYDKDSHKIYPSENVRVIADFPTEYFQVFSSSVNGTYHTVKTLKRGFTAIEGHLKAIISLDGKEFLITPLIKNSQDVEIYDAITVTPPVLVFPWDPSKKANYHYHLEAFGGSGNYTWSSSDSSVTSVNVRGQITTFQIGQTSVSAADVRNTAHTAGMKVFIVPPTLLEFVPLRVEAEIGSTLELPLAMYGHDGVTGRHMFADCRHLPYQVTVTDPAGFTYLEETLPITAGSCTTIKIRVDKLGYTEVTATYIQGRIRLSASVTIAGYKPLKAVDPEDVAVVAVGSSMEVIFKGGPQAWVLNRTEYYQKLNAENPEILTVRHLAGFGVFKMLHTFRVLCRDLGEQELTVTVGNGVTSKNQFPASESATIKFACARPVGLHLSPLMKRPVDLPPCPITQDSSEPIPVHSYHDLHLGVIVTDSNGRRFNNFSSLAFDWELSDLTVAEFGNHGQLATNIQVAESGRKLVDMYQELIMLHKLGPLRVTSTLPRYKRNYFVQQGVTFEEVISPMISATLDLYAVDDPVITPDSISIFNHPSNKVSLNIGGGSGYFLVKHGNTEKARVDYLQKKRTIQVTPVLDGSFVITAYDLCMDVEEHAHSQIHISGVDAIIMQVVDKVELNKEITVRVSVMDKNGEPLQASYFPLMALKAHPASTIISVRPDPEKNSDKFSALYIVHGAALGRTMLKFVAKPPSTHTVASQEKEIQVFPPLRLEPRNITVLVGALFQVTAHGGPQPQSTIEFTIQSATIAEISNSGLIDAMALGQTRVIGRAVGYEAETGRRIVYSEDSIIVHVVQLEGIRIFAPLKRLQTGTQMPLYAMGTNEHETPFTFGSAMPPLNFKWSINNKEAVEINSIYYKSGIHILPDSNFGIQLRAHRPGHVTVSLTVTPSSSSRLQLRNTDLLRDEVQLQVFEKLQLLNPDTCDGSLLITPNTETSIRTNRDSTARLTYEIRSSDSHSPVAMVNEVGQLLTGARSGHASLIVTAHEDFGVNQTIVMLIKVKPVSYLMLNADTVIKTRDRSLQSIPVGSVLGFTVTYHDDVGNQFYTTNTVLKYRPNRFDLIHVHPGTKNSTLVARTTGTGQTVLKVWDQNNPGMADYVNIPVGNAIIPSHRRVTLGDIVCFSSPVITAAGDVGTWSSSSPVVSMMAVSGIGIASRIGTSIVAYTVGELTTNTEVTVTPIQKVIMKNENLQYLTNVPSRSRTRVIPVVLDSGSSHSNLIGVNCSDIVGESHLDVYHVPFRCEASLTTLHPSIDISDLLTVAADFDSTTGQYLCRISEASFPDLVHLVSTLDTSVQVRAMVTSREGQEEVAAEVVSLPFIPAFYLHASEVVVSNLQPLSSLRVSATDRVFQDIKVSSSDPSVVNVLTPEKDTQQDHVMYYPVQLITSAALWKLNKLEVSLEVKCVATGQVHHVSIRIKLHGSDAKDGVHMANQEASWSRLLQVVANNYQSWIFMLLCIFATVAALFIAYHAVLGARLQPSSQQAGVFLQPGQSPITPNFQNPSPWNSPYSTGTSPSKYQLWTSGYDIDTTGGGLHHRTSPNRSPYQT